MVAPCEANNARDIKRPEVREELLVHQGRVGAEVHPVRVFPAFSRFGKGAEDEAVAKDCHYAGKVRYIVTKWNRHKNTLHAPNSDNGGGSRSLRESLFYCFYLVVRVK
jgi:hypothetical protein